MPQPLDFANSNLFNASKPTTDEQGSRLRDAIIREYKQKKNIRNRNDTMRHSEGENLTATADPTIFEDPIPLLHLKSFGSTNHPSLGDAASKLQHVLSQ